MVSFILCLVVCGGFAVDLWSLLMALGVLCSFYALFSVFWCGLWCFAMFRLTYIFHNFVTKYVFFQAESS